MTGRREGKGWPTEVWITLVVLAVLLVIVLQPRVRFDNATSSGTQPAPVTLPTELPRGTDAADGAGALSQLGNLRVAGPEPSLPTYRRALFGDGWSYDQQTGCNTREKVLIDESLEPPVMGARCKPLQGRWVSLYDGATVTQPSDLQIDHFVPLAEAWRSGAARWPAAERIAFANDLTHPNTLIAVTGHTNISKSDSPPQGWMPPDPSAWCSYAERWISVKSQWHLSITVAERDKLTGVLASC